MTLKDRPESDLPIPALNGGLISPWQHAVLDYAVAMTRTPVDVPDALFARLQAQFNAAQLVELTAAIAWQNYRARFDHACGIGAQGFSEGAYCPLPERPRDGSG